MPGARLGLRKAVNSYLCSTNCKAGAMVVVVPDTCGEFQTPSADLLLEGASFVAALGLLASSF